MAICARNAAGVELAAKELGPHGEVVGMAVDASDHPALAAWVEESAGRLGGVDVIVSNASALGGIPHTPEGMVRDECLAEWTVEQGIATRYRFQGNDCSAAATELAAR